MSDTAKTIVFGSALVSNETGLHARPSVKLTQLAKSFASTIGVGIHPDGPFVDAKSPVRLMRVKAPKGATLYFQCEGTDADEATSALINLVNRHFDEA